MKQRLIYLIVLLLSISCVSALSISLTSPPNGAVYVDSNSVTLKCKPLGTDLIQIRLYSDTSGLWSLVATNSNPQNNTDVSFVIHNINNGDYKWNCKVISGTGYAWAPANKTFAINYVNSPPTFSGPISNQTWNKDASKSNAFDLDTYFTEPDSEAMTYSVSGNTNINVNIDSSNQVSFSQPAGWWGTEKIKFRACDPVPQCIFSNEIKLTVSQTACTESWECTSWSSCTSGEQTRTCTDNNNCGTTSTKPAETQSCTEGCEEDWECTVWSECEEEGYKTRTCTDDSGCGTTEDKPAESASCGVTSSYVLEIISSTPSSSTVTITRGTSKVFSIETNLENADVKWYLDNSLQDETSDSFRYTPMSDDIGTHTINVIAEKDLDKDAREWSITVEPSASETVPAECGNDQVESGEDCLTCPEDVTCSENEACDEGLCKVKENKLTGYITKITDPIIDNWYYSLTILALIIITLIVFAVTKNKKRASPLAEFDDKKSIFSRLRTKLRNLDKKRQQKKINKVNIRRLQDTKKEEITATAPTGLGSITNFINESRSNGYSDRQIKKALLRKGWGRKQIKLAFKR